VRWVYRRRSAAPTPTLAVGLDIGKLQQQSIRYRYAGGVAIVVRAHEYDARPLMVRQVVGERAHCLPDSRRCVSLQRLLALDKVRLKIREHLFKLEIGIWRRHPVD
jgi:hypothetical protein